MIPAESPPADSHQATLTRVICRHTAAEPGPTLIVVGGLHGNEPAGIRAARAIDHTLNSNRGVARGEFIALRGNLAALATNPDEPENNPRYLAGDLNRLFKPDHGARTPDHDQRDALRDALDEIAARSRGPLYLLDLHTTSSDSPPFIAVEDSLPARRFAERFALPLILGIEEDLPGLLMDEATERLGCVALTVEGGRHDKPDAIHTLEAVIRIALDALGLVHPNTDANNHTGNDAAPIETTRKAAGQRAHRVYDIRHREPVRCLPFEAAPDAEPFDPVRAHSTVIARQANTDLLAAETGLLFMPNRQRDIRVGDDAYFIVRRVGRAWLALSARLRTHDRLHRLLPRLMPGVRHRPGHPHDLLVDPEIAAVLRREIFHLLGYRLVRFKPTPSHTGFQRATNTARLCARSAMHMARSVLFLHRLDRYRTTQERTDPRRDTGEWIVRRRRLDTR